MTGSAVRGLRARRGWTQAELAERLGTDPVTVSRWERGVSEPRPSALLRLRELATPVPGDVSSLIRLVGEGAAELGLRRALLLSSRPPRHRFAAAPSRRFRQVERARREQESLKAGARMTR